MSIVKYGRFWAVFDPQEVLICLTVYRKGALEVVRRIAGDQAAESVLIYPEGRCPFQKERTPTDESAKRTCGRRSAPGYRRA